MNVFEHYWSVLRRALFVGTNFLAVAVIYLCVVAPILSVFEDRERQIDDQKGLLSRLLSVASREEGLRATEASLGRAYKTGAFLDSGNANVIAANMQVRLKSAIEAAGGRSLAMQSLPPRVGEGKLKYVGVRVEWSGTLQSLYRAAYVMETSEPYLRISYANVKLQPGDGSAEPSIQGQFEVYGLLWPTGPTP